MCPYWLMRGWRLDSGRNRRRAVDFSETPAIRGLTLVHERAGALDERTSPLQADRVHSSGHQPHLQADRVHLVGHQPRLQAGHVHSTSHQPRLLADQPQLPSDQAGSAGDHVAFGTATARWTVRPSDAAQALSGVRFAVRMGVVVAVVLAACGGRGAGAASGGVTCAPDVARARCEDGYACDVALGCVECVVDADCVARDPGHDRNVCVRGLCASCHTSADCSDGAVCGPRDHVCTAPCPAAPCAEGETCDAASGACFGCQTNADCPAERRICGASTKTCVECDRDEDCPSHLPHCAVGNRCVACFADVDCPRDTPVCEREGERAGTCRGGCTSDALCAAPTPRCAPEFRACVACLTASDCGAGQACTRDYACVPCANGSICG